MNIHVSVPELPAVSIMQEVLKIIFGEGGLPFAMQVIVSFQTGTASRSVLRIPLFETFARPYCYVHSSEKKKKFFGTSTTTPPQIYDEKNN